MRRFNPYLPAGLQPDAQQNQPPTPSEKKDSAKVYAGMVTSQMAVHNPPEQTLAIVGKDPLVDVGMHQTAVEDSPLPRYVPKTPPKPQQQKVVVPTMAPASTNGNGTTQNGMDEDRTTLLERRVEQALRDLDERRAELEYRARLLEGKAEELERQSAEIDARMMQLQSMPTPPLSLKKHVSDDVALTLSSHTSRPMASVGKRYSAKRDKAEAELRVSSLRDRQDNFLEMSLEEKEDDTDVSQWVGINMNCYGAFIHRSIHHGMWGPVDGAFVRYGPLIVISFLIQCTFAYELWRELPKAPGPYVCDQPLILQLAAIGVFLFVTCNNIDDMYRHFKIALVSTTCRVAGQPGTEMDVRLSGVERCLIMVFACVSELAAWFAILAVGIMWIFNATTSELVVRTTVAITFVLNVDEAVYATCVPDKHKPEHAKYKYKAGLPGEHFGTKVWNLFDEHLRTVIIVAITCGVVFGVRREDSGCDPY